MVARVPASRVAEPAGTRAVVDPAAIGRGFEVLVQVTMDREDAATVADFERGLAQIPEVRHAERLFGDPDYLLRVATADIAAYQTLRDEKLATLPGVGRLTSTIVMKRVVEERPYPLAPPSPSPAPKRKKEGLSVGLMWHETDRPVCRRNKYASCGRLCAVGRCLIRGQSSGDLSLADADGEQPGSQAPLGPAVPHRPPP
jgi:hypothetical protein